MADEPIPIERLKKRRDFLLVAQGRKVVRGSLVLQANRTPAAVQGPAARIGFTVTKRIGNAVVRNRVRRRLREAALRVLPLKARPGMDYVVIGRAAAKTARFDDILIDLEAALERANRAPRRRKAE